MASSAKRRAIGRENPEDSDDSSDEGLEDSGEESENSEEEINEVIFSVQCWQAVDLRC